jgi:hypothetical protein
MAVVAGRVRFGTDERGRRFAARDFFEETGELAPLWPKHAVWDGAQRCVVWVAHPEGGQMDPFLGPDDAWAGLIAGGEELWPTSGREALG